MPRLLLLLLLVVASVVMRLVSVLLRRLRRLVAGRLRKRGIENNGELGKRVDTLLGILKTALKVIVWLTLRMLFLNQIGVNVARIIAGINANAYQMFQVCSLAHRVPAGEPRRQLFGLLRFPQRFEHPRTTAIYVVASYLRE